VTSHRLCLAVCLILLSSAPAPATRSPTAVEPAPVTMDEVPRSPTVLAQAQVTPTPAAPAATPTPAPSPTPASPTPAASDEPIGNVATLSGVATVIRNKDSIALKLKDDIYLNDTVQTAAASALGVTFNDGTTFHLQANAKITIDNYVYEDGGKDNSGIFDIGKGTVAFVAAAVAKTGDMKITTPTSTLGIRGTTGLVEVPEGGGAGNNVNIKLYPDPDGHVGRIEVNDRTGQRLGALTQGASGFTIRPPSAPGGRISAEPLRISSQQAARDQGFVRQVHAAQNVGRQIVTEQRALRRANPNAVPNRNNPPRQPTPQPQTPQRQNSVPGQKGQPQPVVTPNRRGEQPVTRPQAVPPNRQGSQQPAQPGQPQQQPQRSGQTRQQGEKPGTPAQPAVPPRPGEPPRPENPRENPKENPRENPRQGGHPGTPAAPNLHEPALRQGAPNLPRPGVLRPPRPSRPAAAPPKRPPPKGKPPKPE
jgi:FecR protein